MDAIIGRYRMSIEETGLVLKHQAGISFDLTVEETLGLRDFITIYQKTLVDMQEEKLDRQTDPDIKAILLNLNKVDS